MSDEWTTFQYSKSRVKKAGKILREPGGSSTRETRQALQIMSNWRSVHSYALNSAQVSLRRRVQSVTEARPDVTQRLKEKASIIAKLKRGAPRAQLSTMQDIAGCRAVVGTVEQVYELVQMYRRSGSRKSNLVGIDDYIKKPSDAGYRGVHLITEYYDRPNDDRRYVEIQLRTETQHTWAVGVEELGNRYGYPLKHDEGPAEVLEYLHIASLVFEADEMTGRVPPDLLQQLRDARRTALQVLKGQDDDE